MKLFDIVNSKLRAADGHPRIMVEAMKLFGTKELAGPGDNRVILSWAAEIGQADRYVHDVTPWCGLFAGVTVQRAGYHFPADPLWALNWAHFGNPVQAHEPMFGDVLVFKRPGGGHVGFYAAEDDSHFWVLGGNQGDQVCFAPVLKHALFAFRRPPYQSGAGERGADPNRGRWPRSVPGLNFLLPLRTPRRE
jgi:uncharacterized protein (TIGR02594 family)